MNVYTDGSCINNGKPNAKAGIGIWFAENDERNTSKELDGEVSNNIAELKAILYVFNILKDEIRNKEIINIYSDSDYSIKSITTWADSWEKNGWKKKDNSEPKNLDLIKKLHKLFKKFNNVSIYYIAAHTNATDTHSKGNECADELAKKAINIKKTFNEKKIKKKNSKYNQNIKLDSDYIFTFGKYKGRDSKWVKENDEGYIEWCIDNLSNKYIVEKLNNL